MPSSNGAPACPNSATAENCLPEMFRSLFYRGQAGFDRSIRRKALNGSVKSISCIDQPIMHATEPFNRHQLWLAHNIKSCDDRGAQNFRGNQHAEAGQPQPTGCQIDCQDFQRKKSQHWQKEHNHGQRRWKLKHGGFNLMNQRNLCDRGR